MRLKLLFLLLVILSFNVFAQITDEELGAAMNKSRAGLYDFSDPGAVNIKVAVWGYVARPGKYIVPDYTLVSDLLSYAGGPNQNSEMDDLRIYRIDDNGKEEMIKFSYNDIMWGDKINVRNRIVPKLKASDILIVPGSPKLFFADWFRIGLQLFSAVLSIISIYILIQRYH